MSHVSLGSLSKGVEPKHGHHGSETHELQWPQIVLIYAVVSKIITPETFCSELIRRGVLYYSGKILPQIIFIELILRGYSVSHYVVKIYSKNLMGINFQRGNFRIAPQNCFELIVIG